MISRDILRSPRKCGAKVGGFLLSIWPIWSGLWWAFPDPVCYDSTFYDFPMSKIFGGISSLKIMLHSFLQIFLLTSSMQFWVCFVIPILCMLIIGSSFLERDFISCNYDTESCFLSMSYFYYVLWLQFKVIWVVLRCFYLFSWHFSNRSKLEHLVIKNWVLMEKQYLKGFLLWTLHWKTRFVIFMTFLLMYGNQGLHYFFWKSCLFWKFFFLMILFAIAPGIGWNCRSSNQKVVCWGGFCFHAPSQYLV